MYNFDFSLQSYASACQQYLAAGGQFFTVKDWIEKSPNHGCVIRHDVDRNPKCALEMARLENELGFSSTYYFRVIGTARNPSIIREIKKLGHEVGYHYEDFCLCRGNLKLAAKSFRENLAWIRQIAEVSTVSMHGSPLSKFNNLDIWDVLNLSDEGLLGDAFLTINYQEIFYFTDTGRSWSGINLRDMPPNAVRNTEIKTTKELTDFLISSTNRKVAICSHPERWNADMTSWMIQLIKDNLANFLKKLVKLVRK